MGRGWGGEEGGEWRCNARREIWWEIKFVKNLNWTKEMNEASLISSPVCCSGKRRKAEVLPSVCDSSSLICHSQSSAAFVVVAVFCFFVFVCFLKLFDHCRYDCHESRWHSATVHSCRKLVIVSTIKRDYHMDNRNSNVCLERLTRTGPKRLHSL